MRIIMGTAYCLQYMHELNPPISHTKLVSSAIYLTDDYAAKVLAFLLNKKTVLVVLSFLLDKKTVSMVLNQNPLVDNISICRLERYLLADKPGVNRENQ